MNRCPAFGIIAVCRAAEADDLMILSRRA